MFRRALFAILALLSTFTVVLCIWSPKNPQTLPICTSPACTARGQEYIANMLRNADPCQDFYSFACGSWEKNHPIPPYTDWDVAHQMDENTLATLKKLLDEMTPRATHDDPEYAKLKLVYDTCMKLPHYGKHSPQSIGAFLRKIGRFPTKKIWDLHSEYLHLTGESAFFDLNVGSFDHHINLPMLRLSVPASAYGSIFHDVTWTPLDEKNYAQALYEIISGFGFKESGDALKRRIKSVLQFRHKLNMLIARVFTEDDDDDTQLSPHELQKIFMQKGSNSYKSQIPWEKTTRILLRDVATKEAMKRNIIVLHCPDYFAELASFLSKSTEQDIADHMEFYFIERHFKFTDKALKLLKNTWEHAPPHHRLLRFDEPRWMTCIKESNLQSVLLKLFASKWLKAEHKEQVHTILTGLKSAINARMTKSTWLDAETRLVTARRIEEIKGLVGDRPAALERYSPTESVFPNAFLDTTNDILFVHAAMLQSPVFDHRLPPMYNLATAGFMLGHEYYHVIDDCGNYRVSFLKSVNMWPPKMQKQCNERKKCFITEYNKFTKTEFQRRYKLSPKIDTSKSFLENYPDVMGLEAALMLHEKIKEKYGGKCEILPGFAGYSCDQMFFVAFANMWCGTPPPKQALLDLNSASHSINPVRVNGALSSTEAFAKAFQCGRRDLMNPSIKCNLWK